MLKPLKKTKKEDNDWESYGFECPPDQDDIDWLEWHEQTNPWELYNECVPRSSGHHMTADGKPW